MKKQLLIEQGSFVTLDLVESKKTGKVIAKGEYGRVDVPTDNGRVYSRKITESNINRLSEAMSNKHVYGELDHPCLTENNFNVLTSVGWKPFVAIEKGDYVWSRVEGKAVLSKVEGIVDEPYNGKVYHVNGRNIDSTFTPAHKFILSKRPDKNDLKKEEYVVLNDIVNSDNKYSHHAIPKTAIWENEDPKSVFIPAVEGNKRNKHNVNEDLEIDSKVFAGFMGIYLSEGSCSNGKNQNYNVFVTQINEWSKKYIKEEILDKFPIKWSEDKDGFRIADKRLFYYLKKLGTCYDKYVPEEVKKLSTDNLREFLFWFMIGDGRVDSSFGKLSESKTDKEVLAKDLRIKDLTNSRSDVFSVSKKLIDDLHECLLKTGRSGSLTTIMPDKDYEFAGRIIKAENKVPLHQLHFSNTKNIWMDERFINIDEKHHKGNIYCLTVTHGNFYMEQNGKSFWTGNSDGKTKLARVSHLLVGLEINEEGIVIGKSEILDTPSGKILKAILKAGGKVGVSSRGFGTVKTSHDGNQHVNEDYVLKTYDFVADPAMTTAYPDIFTEDKDIDKNTLIEDHFTSDMLRSSFPELVSELLESVSFKEKEAKLREDFKKELLSKVQEMKVEALENAKKELMEDVKYKSGSSAILEQIYSMVSIYKGDSDEIALRDAIDVKDSKIAELENEKTESFSLAKESSYKLIVERAFRGYSDIETINKEIGNVSDYENMDELKSKISDLKEEFNGEVETQMLQEETENKNTISVLNEDLRNSRISNKTINLKLLESTALVDILEDKKEELDTKLEETELDKYKYESVLGKTNYNSLLKHMKYADTKEKIDEIIEEFGSVTMKDEDMRKVREKATKGISHVDKELKEATEVTNNEGFSISKYTDISTFENLIK